MTFTYDKNGFYFDGVKTKIASGSLHYFRVVPEYWHDRLLKLREMGCNCVDTYTCWNLHEKNEGEFDFEHYKQIHHFLFCDIYDWAGQIRDINLSKKGTDFVSADQIDACAKSCFQRLQSFHAKGLSRRELAEELADFYHTINMLHPFREGNGRVQRAFFEQWAEERLGCSLNLTAVDADAFMIATIFAAQGIMDQLINCFETMLQPLEIDMGMHMF